MAAKIKALYPQNKHPRLITTQTEIDWIKANYQNDDYLKVAVPSFLNNYCAGYKNSMPSATSATAIANQAASMALAYHLTEDAGYKEACWRNMLALTKSAVSWTPDSSNLTLGDTSRAVAVTYDLMYNFWTEEQRMIVRNAMILYALEPMRANLLRENGGDAQATNWNPIINSGLGMCALALADTDAGAFVLEALGKRWISLPSNEDYNLDAMFGSKRYQYYRNRAEGSNTLVIGPGVHQGSATANDSQASTESLLDQKKLSTALIEQSKTAINASKGAYSILNLTDAYSATADSAKRGLALVNNRNAFLLQDEIDVKSVCDVYSFLHMSKDITVTVAQDGQSATLAWGSDTLKVTLLSDCSATLQLMEAAPLSTSPNVQSTDNSSLQKLAVKASSVNDKATFALLITSASSSFTIDTIVPLNQWDAFLQ